jgi:uncharacterized protein (DUF362 family)
MAQSSVILRSVKDRPIQDVVEELMEFCRWEDIVPPNGKVYIKPNLCTELIEKVEAANTSPALIEAICRVLLKKTPNITICESDGARYLADTAFQNTGLDVVAKRLGVKWVNLSNVEGVSIGHKIFDSYSTLLPKELLEADVLINLPVLKTHALTVFTGCVKNLWGCVPRYDRIWLHKHLDELLSDLVGILKPSINIMDAIVCAEGRGPTNGIPRRLDLLLAGTDPVALDSASMRLVGLDPLASRHITLAWQKGFGNLPEDSIAIDGDFQGLKVEFIPAVLDFAVASMNYMTRFHWFVTRILFNEAIFQKTKKLVVALRRIGLLAGGELDRIGNAPEKVSIRK